MNCEKCGAPLEGTGHLCAACQALETPEQNLDTNPVADNPAPIDPPAETPSPMDPPTEPPVTPDPSPTTEPPAEPPAEPETPDENQPTSGIQ